MRAIIALSFLAIGAPAFAQTAPAPDVARFAKAPWWMDQPIIASTGYVKTDVQANRARFSATFQVVSKTSPEATKAAADKVRELGAALSAYGADKVRVETTFNMRPIYDQYRDKDGNLISNQRADKIDSYEVNANVSVEVRDVSLVERAYATVLAARPTTTQPVNFTLDPDNAIRTELFNLGVADARRRAQLAVESAGGKLGAIKLIDPTGRACETDVLVAGAPREYDDSAAQNVSLRSAMMEERAAPPPSAPRPSAPRGEGLRPEDMQLPLQPPLQTLTSKACVVYALAG